MRDSGSRGVVTAETKSTSKIDGSVPDHGCNSLRPKKGQGRCWRGGRNTRNSRVTPAEVQREASAVPRVAGRARLTGNGKRFEPRSQ